MILSKLFVNWERLLMRQTFTITPKMTCRRRSPSLLKKQESLRPKGILERSSISLIASRKCLIDWR